MSDSALSICSALAAAEHGDARRALDLLRVAGEVAERQGATIITEEHVRQAEKHIEHNRVVEALKNLTLHSKLVLLSVYHLNKPSATYRRNIRCLQRTLRRNGRWASDSTSFRHAD